MFVVASTRATPSLPVLPREPFSTLTTSTSSSGAPVVRSLAHTVRPRSSVIAWAPILVDCTHDRTHSLSHLLRCGRSVSTTTTAWPTPVLSSAEARSSCVSTSSSAAAGVFTFLSKTSLPGGVVILRS